MPYRLCTFDSDGKIIAVSPESYSDDSDVIFPYASRNTAAYSLIDEALIPSEVIDFKQTSEEDYEVIFEGATVTAKPISNNRSAFYGPDTEVTLYLMDEYDRRYIRRGFNLIQDVTKVENVYNIIAPSTRPVHTENFYKFAPSSGKFTKSTSGYTGGFLYITNLSKYDGSGGNTAPHNNIGVGLTFSWAFEMFFYPTGTLSSNFTLLQKGPLGTAANWKLGYDSSAGQLQFAWQSYGSTAGYNYTQNIVNTAGITLNTWHHVAVAMVRTGSTSVGYQLSGYFNGSNKFSVGVTSSTTPEVRYGGGLYLGNNSSGSESFNGYIDSFRVLESPGTGGLFGPSGYGFLPFGGGTLGVPTAAGFTRNSQTALILNFNNIENAPRFYVESMDFISGIVTKVTTLNLGDIGFTGATSGNTGSNIFEVGVKNIFRYTVGFTAGATLYSDPTGFTTNYGDVAIPFVNTTPIGSTNTIPHGYDYAWKLNSVFDNAPSIDVYRRTYRNDLRYEFGLEMMTVIEGICGDRGSLGNIFAPQFGQNPFTRLFNGATGGCGNCYGIGLAHNSLFLNPRDATTMQYIMNNGYLVDEGISESTYEFVDAIGINRVLSPTDISNLRLDILDYQRKILNGYRTVKAEIDAASTKNDIKIAKVKKSYNPLITEELLGPEDYGGIEGL